MNSVTSIRMRFQVIVPLIIGGMIIVPTTAAKNKSATHSVVKAITSTEQLRGILDSSGSSLLMFDLYADWCLPCRQLTPVLERIATDLKSSVTFYKINIDKSPDIASIFQVGGIPYVVFVKEKQVVQAFVGLQPEAAYRRAILIHGTQDQTGRNDQPDGTLVDGVRVITLSTAMNVGNLYVYRGEEVKLVFGKVDFPYEVHIPTLNAKGSAKAGEDLTIVFKAKETGVFTMMCNGKCPVGDGQQFARIVVLEYTGTAEKAIFKNLSVKEAKELIASEKPLLLDVRTPGEYYEGHIAGATLVPLQQLAARINELESYKQKPVLVYCRSGNRSIPASQILMRNGFSKVYNMQHGILEWIREKLPLEKTL